MRSNLLPAVVASALLHLVIGSAFALRPFGAAEPEPTATRPALRVTMVAPEVHKELNEGGSLAPALEGSGPNQGLTPKASVETISGIAQGLADAREAMSTEPILQESQPNNSPATETGEPGGQETPTVVLDSGQLQSAIGTYLASYKSGLVEEWVEACAQHRSRKTSEKTCPDDAAEEGNVPTAHLFEFLPVPMANNNYDSRQLLAESRYLETLATENSILGVMARERYAWVREQYCFLNACGPRGHNEPEGEVVELISVGSGN